MTRHATRRSLLSAAALGALACGQAQSVSPPGATPSVEAEVPAPPALAEGRMTLGIEYAFP